MSRSRIYNNIKDRLLEKLEGIRVVDMQKGQFKMAKDNYPLPLPALLIGINPVSWSNTTGEQIGDGIISIYYYKDLVTDSFDEAESEAETIEVLDSFDEIYRALQGFRGDDFNSLIRINDKIEAYDKTYICFKTDFKTAIDQEVFEISRKANRPEPKFN